LLDLRKASGGQQDVGLFFSRILDEKNPEYRKNFHDEYMTVVRRILVRIKEIEARSKAAEQNTENVEQNDEQQATEQATEQQQ